MKKLLFLIALMLLAGLSQAKTLLQALTENTYTGPTVEQNVAAMDTDKNGFADVMEVRAFLVLKHGKDYEKGVLDRWEVRAMGGGCPIPFAKEFVSDAN